MKHTFPYEPVGTNYRRRLAKQNNIRRNLLVCFAVGFAIVVILIETITYMFSA